MRTVFISLIASELEKQNIQAFIRSLRRFGGSLSSSPVWLFEVSPRVSCNDLAGADVQVFPLKIPTAIRAFPLAGKVAACAQAEAMLPGDVSTLVWCNAECLVVQPPELLKLEKPLKAAFRPVHIRNVGIPAGEPLDAYWQAIHTAAGAVPGRETVTTFVDGVQIRPYFNTHTFSVDPSLGICGGWLDLFSRLILDEYFLSGTCADELHQIFLHQAVLSILVSKQIPFDQIRILPPVYSYPYHLQAKIPASRRVNVLNDLVLPVYEDDHPLDPETCTDMEIRDPLRSWLTEIRK